MPLNVLYHHRIRSKDGQYVHMEEMLSVLRAMGHVVTVSGPGEIEEEDFGGSGKLVPWLKQKLPKTLYEILEFCYSVPDFVRLCRAIQRTKPDVIYERYNLLFVSGIWAKKWFKLPLLLEVNAPIYEERRDTEGIGLNRLAAWSERYCWQNADMNLPVTNVLAQHLERAGVPRQRMEVIHNGINVHQFERVMVTEAAKERLGLEGRTVLGFVGFVREWHGLRGVLQILTRFPDAALVVIGDGPEIPHLEALARDLGIEPQLHLLGLRERSEIPQLVASFDVALQPNVVPYASPLKMFEYMALAKPIIAPDTANIREILEHEFSAELFDVGTEDAFERAISRVLTDREYRDRLGANAQATIDTKGFTWQQNGERVTRIAESLRCKNESLVSEIRGKK